MPLPNQPAFFDPTTAYAVVEGRLPHWEQAGVVAFVTFRTWDSIPQKVMARFLAERNAWLKAHGIDTTNQDWQTAAANLPAEDRATFRRFCTVRWEESLDGCHGTCPLRVPARSGIVADSLRHFDGERYLLFDYVVMPNHVHVLAAFPEAGAMQKQCESWKHFTAVHLNKLLGRTGRFWEEESFDHLIRSEVQFEHLREYIAGNPAKAGLLPDEYAHYSCELTSSLSRTALSRPLAERADHITGAIP